MNIFSLVLMIVLAVVIGVAVMCSGKSTKTIGNASGLSAAPADALAAFDDRAVSNDRAEWRVIKHFAIQHAAVFKREMHEITVFG